MDSYPLAKRLWDTYFQDKTYKVDESMTQLVALAEPQEDPDNPSLTILTDPYGLLSASQQHLQRSEASVTNTPILSFLNSTRVLSSLNSPSALSPHVRTPEIEVTGVEFPDMMIPSDTPVSFDAFPE
eukprot:gnl/Dysnectes_brevis/2796_a3410_1416.p1 GENE.gnl/Dysnectes_brevis/2796_a3410_1416~~gnl/Dysnectes_brevis/2796_a3410_1416.p1  ORF type:complete len:127 (-),score=19.86 gnl/Dysnectes_brevis/2796_a3410_1416:41-421(-)